MVRPNLSVYTALYEGDGLTADGDGEALGNGVGEALGDGVGEPDGVGVLSACRLGTAAEVPAISAGSASNGAGTGAGRRAGRPSRVPADGAAVRGAPSLVCSTAGGAGAATG